MTTPHQFTPAQEAWLIALESGQYVQGIGNLCCNGKYCCLGVACEIAISNGIEVSKKVREDKIQYGYSTMWLPLQVGEWLGVTTNAASLLAELNDKDHLTFKQIAATVRARPSKFFRP